MIKAKITTIYPALVFMILFAVCTAGRAQQITKVAPGIWKIVYGESEAIKPGDFKDAAMDDALKQMSSGSKAPDVMSTIKFSKLDGGVSAHLTMDAAERIYGFGLQVNTFEQRGMRREIRTNSKIIGNIGYSHAPMPFYISSNGYGVLVNTSRYVNFYMGSQHKISESVGIKDNITKTAEPGSTLSALYNKQYKSSNDVEIQVKGARGMEILIFEGPTMKNVMERYNLYSGGGAIPPLWGLGFKYRAKNTFTEKEVLPFSQYFRDNHIPCDMFGLEPGWQSAAYSCSYIWNPVKYPTPDSLITVMTNRHYKLNLWEHAYVHPTSPIFDAIVPYSGDYAVWKGAVPDFAIPKTRAIFGDYHNTNFIKKGISAFKLDECDGAYYDEASGEWSFPDIAKFPSGMDGEQYRQIFGLLYQKTILDQYKKENSRTVLEARASYLFAAPYSAVLYTDMYSHADFVRMVVNSGFSGVNWSPEVRDIRSENDLLRRLQTSMMSAHMNVDCWFLKNLPWYQFNRDKNNKDELLPNAKELEQKVKKLIETRMSLIPYLYAAFADYHYKGVPPFRALVLDYPEDKDVWKTDDQYMMGENILCAPFLDGASTRDVYFPKGTWYDFNSNKKYEGGKKYSITMSMDEVPMFVKEGTILPLAKSVEYITPETVFDINCRVYGNADNKSVHLFEDNSYTFNYEQNQYNWLTLQWNGKKGTTTRTGTFKKKLYRIAAWEQVN
jgi:alpha-D-xyloside xylohydrolase